MFQVLGEDVQMSRAIAILTGGGDRPALNAVTRAVNWWVRRKLSESASAVEQPAGGKDGERDE